MQSDVAAAMKAERTCWRASLRMHPGRRPSSPCRKIGIVPSSAVHGFVPCTADTKRFAGQPFVVLSECRCAATGRSNAGCSVPSKVREAHLRASAEQPVGSVYAAQQSEGKAQRSKVSESRWQSVSASHEYTKGSWHQSNCALLVNGRTLNDLIWLCASQHV
jgi:hypothetical protein